MKLQYLKEVLSFGLHSITTHTSVGKIELVGTSFKVFIPSKCRSTTRISLAATDLKKSSSHASFGFYETLHLLIKFLNWYRVQCSDAEVVL